MIYLYLFGTCFHFIYVFMIIDNDYQCLSCLGEEFIENALFLFNNHWIRFLVKKGLAIMVKIVRIFK